jgi:hypothetical protein
MTKSKTTKTSGFPGVKPHYYKTTISENGKSRSGVGKTSEESQKNASKKRNKK